MTETSVGKDKLLWAIYLALATVMVITESDIALLFNAAGIVAWLWRAPPQRWCERGQRVVLLHDPWHSMDNDIDDISYVTGTAAP